MLDDRKHGSVNGSDHRSLSLRVLAGKQVHPHFRLDLLEVIERADEVGKQLYRLDRFNEDEHVLVFEHVGHSVVD